MHRIDVPEDTVRRGSPSRVLFEAVHSEQDSVGYTTFSTHGAVVLAHKSVVALACEEHQEERMKRPDNANFTHVHRRDFAQKRDPFIRHADCNPAARCYKDQHGQPESEGLYRPEDRCTVQCGLNSKTQAISQRRSRNHKQREDCVCVCLRYS